MESNQTSISFLRRLGLAFRVLFDSELAARALGPKAAEPPAPTAPVPPERVHASGLLLLNAFQREGRLIDFLQQEVASFSDAEIGAAARVVHGGCRKVLRQYFDLQPATPEAEGSSITIPQGFDSRKLRLTGNISGSPPFRGTVRHHGWIAQQIRLPAVSEAIDPRVVAPAEVELA